MRLVNRIREINSYITKIQMLRFSFLAPVIKIMDIRNKVEALNRIVINETILNVVMFLGKFECFIKLITIVIIINTPSIIVIGYVAKIELHIYSNLQSSFVILLFFNVLLFNLHFNFASYFNLQFNTSPF